MKANSVAMPRPPLRESLAALFADPREKAFFFALDGVLVPARDVGGDAPSENPVALLADLERAAGGAVAILSGDPLDVVDQILSPLRPAGCGLGGLEIRTQADGPRVKRRIAADLDPVRRLLGTAATFDPGLTVIDGGLFLSLCHGGDPMRAAAARAFAREAVALASAVFRADFGDRETRVTFAGVSMGSAVCRIMEGACFADRIPIVFGPAGRSSDFLVVAQFYGGTAIAVGRTADPDADIHLDGPRDVQWIVRDFLAHLEFESGGVP